MWKAGINTPGAKKGETILVGFTLAGQTFQALNGGRHDAFNESISLSVTCRDQAELDRVWYALSSEGGSPAACGWVKDKYGVRWQVVPEELPALMMDPDPVRVERVMTAVINMIKLDIATLNRAHAGL